MVDPPPDIDPEAWQDLCFGYPLFLCIRREKPIGPRRLDAARPQTVDPDIHRSQLHGQLLAEHADGGIEGTARRVQRHRLLSRAGDVEDGAAAPALQVRYRGPAAAYVTQQFSVDCVGKGFVRQVDERAEGGRAGVVHRDIDTAEFFGRSIDKTFAPVQRPHVRWYGEYGSTGLFRDPRRCLFKLRSRARADRDRRAFRRKSLGDALADAFAGASHQRQSPAPICLRGRDPYLPLQFDRKTGLIRGSIHRRA